MTSPWREDEDDDPLQPLNAGEKIFWLVVLAIMVIISLGLMVTHGQ